MSIEQKPEDNNQQSESHHQDEQYGPPHGAVKFVAIMLIGYIAYYAFIWIEVFVIRGA